MAALDLFFKLAVPFAFFCLVFARVAMGVDRTVGIYDSAEGESRRDAINRAYNTNGSAIVIGGIFVILWAMTIASVIQGTGALFFSLVIGAFLTIPFMAVCAGVIMLYTFAVHGYANLKARRGR